MRTEFRHLRLRALAALALAAAVWLPALHLFYAADVTDILRHETVHPMARQLAAHHLRLWTDASRREREVARMRASNAEWDFMARSFFVWGLANLALRDPAVRDEALDVIDRILDETLRLEVERGHLHFLMAYARLKPFRQDPPRSLFVDGEIALMLAARRLVREHPPYQPLLAERVRLIAAAFGVVHAAGFRECVTLLSGSATTAAPPGAGTVAAAALYLLAYLAFLLGGPILILAAALLQAADALARRRGRRA